MERIMKDWNCTCITNGLGYFCNTPLPDEMMVFGISILGDG